MPHVVRIAALLFAVALVAQAGEARAAHCGDYVRFGDAKATASQAGETSLPVSEPGHGECRQAPVPLSPVPAAPVTSPTAPQWAAWLGTEVILARAARPCMFACSAEPCDGFPSLLDRPPKISFSSF